MTPRGEYNLFQEDNWLHEVTRGCSSFLTEGLEEYEFEHTDGYTYSITKETCEGTNCNIAQDAPGIVQF